MVFYKVFSNSRISDPMDYQSACDYVACHGGQMHQCHVYALSDGNDANGQPEIHDQQWMTEMELQEAQAQAEQATDGTFAWVRSHCN